LRVNNKSHQARWSENDVIFYVDSMVPSISLPTAGTVLCIGVLAQDNLWFTCLMTPPSYLFFFISVKKW